MLPQIPETTLEIDVAEVEAVVVDVTIRHRDDARRPDATIIDRRIDEVAVVVHHTDVDQDHHLVVALVVLGRQWRDDRDRREVAVVDVVTIDRRAHQVRTQIASNQIINSALIQFISIR